VSLSSGKATRQVWKDREKLRHVAPIEEGARGSWKTRHRDTVDSRRRSGGKRAASKLPHRFHCCPNAVSWKRRRTTSTSSRMRTNPVTRVEAHRIASSTSVACPSSCRTLLQQKQSASWPVRHSGRFRSRWSAVAPIEIVLVVPEGRNHTRKFASHLPRGSPCYARGEMQANQFHVALTTQARHLKIVWREGTSGEECQST